MPLLSEALETLRLLARSDLFILSRLVILRVMDVRLVCLEVLSCWRWQDWGRRFSLLLEGVRLGFSWMERWMF